MTSRSPLVVVLHFVQAYPVPILLSILTFHLLRNKYGKGISQIPGPALAGWTSLWRFNNVREGRGHWTIIDLHKKYGKLVRTAPDVVDVADPAMIPVIYNIKGDFTKTGFYPIQSISWKKKPRFNLFSTRDEVFHREDKKKVANAYSMTSLLEMEYAVDDCSKIFMQKLRGFSDKGETVDLGAWLQYYAFDVVGEFTFQKKLGFLEKGGDVDDMMKTIEGILFYSATIGQVPELHPFLLGNPLLPHLLPQMENWNSVLTFTLKAINSRTALTKDGELSTSDSSSGQDMLSRWLSVKATDSLKMSTEDIVVHLSTNVFAGSDTTAIVLRAIIYYLCKNPSCMSKLVKEIDDNEYRLSEFVSYKESKEYLPYLNAVLKEGMRIHPSVGLLLERHVPKGGAVISGMWIPEGTKVGINAWVLHFDERIYEEPERFWPERWLTGDEKKLAEMEKSFFAFGAGSRTCIGKNISLMEMGKIIPQLLREFEIELVNEEWRTKNVWFVQQSGLDVRLKRRAGKSNSSP
ncbi:putative cytochrome P450 pisatin demethylase [Acephala macrosclerotiorum]|nr:putative cytochrome P450 pisatin demethylase [Acephala macrosclerotiorum]